MKTELKSAAEKREELQTNGVFIRLFFVLWAVSLVIGLIMLYL